MIASLDPGPAPAGRLVTAGDGLDYHVITLGPPAPKSGIGDRAVDGSDPDPVPAVLLHGGGPGCSAWTDFGAVAPLFAGDRVCYLVDLLQYGASAKPTIAGPRWSWLARSMVSLFDALGLDRVDLICNSWGGTIAIALAADSPARVRSLVITGSMPVFHGPLGPLPERGRRGRNARDAYFGGEGPTFAKMRQLMADLEWFDEAAIPTRTVELRYRQSTDPDEMDLAAQSDDRRGDWQDLDGHLGRIDVPVLFCWGMYDAFLTPDYPLMLARMAPRGQLYVMDRASHHLQEERPWDYYTVVSGFLDQDHDR